LSSKIRRSDQRASTWQSSSNLTSSHRNTRRDLNWIPQHPQCRRLPVILISRIRLSSDIPMPNRDTINDASSRTRCLFDRPYPVEILAGLMQRVHAAALPTVTDRGTARAARSRGNRAMSILDCSLLLRHFVVFGGASCCEKSQLPNDRNKVIKDCYMKQRSHFRVHPCYLRFPFTTIRSLAPLRLFFRNPEMVASTKLALYKDILRWPTVTPSVARRRPQP